MRRISLALALLGAAAAGCGGGKTSDQGGARGVAEGTFTITIQNGQNQLRDTTTGVLPLEMLHGRVTSSPAGINCAAGSTTGCSATFASTATVRLTAAPDTGFIFLGWAGDCLGDNEQLTCDLSGKADKYVVARFGGVNDLRAHANFSAPATHATEYLAFWQQTPPTPADAALPQVNGVWQCTNCHGPGLQGVATAPACNLCHGMVPLPGKGGPLPENTAIGKHFEASGHNSGQCARCHAGAGFRDFVGADGTASNLTTLTYAGADYTAASGPLCDKNATPPVTESCWNDPTTAGRLSTTAQWYYANGFSCAACHNAVTEPINNAGTWAKEHTFTSYPANKTLTLDASTAICAQCHDGARPKYEVKQVNTQLAAAETAGVTDLDAALGTAGTSPNALVRAHYLPSASTLYGEEAGSYFEYSVACSIPGNYTKAACEAANDGKATPTYGVWKGFKMSNVAADRNNYTARNEHGGLNSCVSCHNAHTGELPADTEIEAKCGGCHFDELSGGPVRSFTQLEESRQFGFEGDIDGNLVAEPLKVELDGLRAKLLAAITNYAKNVTGTEVCFDGENRFFADDGTGGGTAGDGICAPASCTLGDAYHDSTSCTAAGGTWNPGESNSPNFTARLLRGAYNFLLATNDVGAWAHNPRYVSEVMYDAIADLNAGLVAKSFAASPNGLRAFNGHFGGAEDASQYAAIIYHGAANATTGESLPPMGFTSNDCYQCHGGAGGFKAYVDLQSTTPQAVLPAGTITDANKVAAFQCSTCHVNDGVDMKGFRTDVATVWFPPQKGATTPSVNAVSFAAANLPRSFPMCGTCHAGRENGLGIDNKIAAAPASGPGIFNKSSTNPHYLGAAGMMLGDNAKMMYQYAGKSYTANPAFWAAGTNGDAPGPHGSPHGADCVGCHQPKATKHEFGVNFAYCATCHAGNYALAPIEEEYHAATTELFSAMQSYVTANLPAVKAAVVAAYPTGTNNANANAMTNICFNGAAYPYWYVYTDTCTTTGFAKFDSKLLAASFNYMWTQKEPGAWAHNEFYVFQAMYDSIVDLGLTPTFTVKAKTLPYPSTLCDPASPLNRGCTAP